MKSVINFNMPRKSGRIFIGTSGWNYNHWKGVFYPESLTAKEWFAYYREKFDTVEINNTFYNLPALNVFKNWKRQAPAGFTYAVKANRYITHMKKLKNPGSALKKFFSGIDCLKGSLGPVLYQLPPHWGCNTERLKEFIEKLPRDKFHVFEFRNDSWFTKEVFKILDSHNVSFCVHDMPYVKCPENTVGKIAYLRLHGAAEAYCGGYPTKTLKKWAGWINAQAKNRDVYVYFNNDAEGHAPEDAAKLKKLLAIG
ncbi:MAG: DUF72 domain-containing protein [Candidatus Omnitrophota bacterium]|nr:DUF72 domain-containing protein [Candidatus Omnitrophota bacterium]